MTQQKAARETTTRPADWSYPDHVHVVANQGQQGVEINHRAVYPEQADEEEEESKRQYVLKGRADYHNKWQKVRSNIRGEFGIVRLDLINRSTERAALASDAEKY
jgi:hypothetical protein